MARPPKDEKLRMVTDLRIPVTIDQKQLILNAVATEPSGLAAWARQVLLSAANERLKGQSHENKSRRGASKSG